MHDGPNGNSFLIGVILGFFGGCMGVAAAALLSGQKYLSGALAGFVGALVLGSLVMVPAGLLAVGGTAEQAQGIEYIGSLDGRQEIPDLPWDLLFALLTGGLVVTGGVFGALRILQQSGENDIEDPPDDPKEASFVQFDA